MVINYSPTGGGKTAGERRKHEPIENRWNHATTHRQRQRVLRAGVVAG